MITVESRAFKHPFKMINSLCEINLWGVGGCSKTIKSVGRLITSIDFSLSNTSMA